MYDVAELAAAGYQNEPVPLRYFHQEAHSGHLAVILPGLGYSADRPLLYYPAKLLLEQGADVLLVDYDYRAAWQEDRPFPEKLRRLEADVDGAVRAALAQRVYNRLTLVGKSLGTFGVLHLLEADLPMRPGACIYLTPVLPLQRARAGVMSTARHLVVMGTADRYYDEALLVELIDNSAGEVLLVDGADHSLEFPGALLRSLETLAEVMQRIRRFLLDASGLPE
jgi:predicted alpha/beta-hydrolase family hydrolase